jgi:gliding motility-associated-like protein
MTTNMIDDPIYQGPLGTWRDISGNVISNPFIIPAINGQQNFNFTYTTRTPEGCVDSANLAFTVFEAYQPGVNQTINVCSADVPFNLFDQLGGTPSNTGTWTGPNGYSTTDYIAMFDPATSEAGIYTYTVPNNLDANGAVICNGGQATVTVALRQSPNAGNNGSFSVCKSEQQIDLSNYLSPSADNGGIFTDLSTTNALTGNILDVSQLNAGRYNFQYEVTGHTSCAVSRAIITISIQTIAPPTANNQKFCASDAPTISDLVANNGLDFNWYATEDATTPLSGSTLLINGEDYFVAAVDANNCESTRVAILVELLPLGHVECDCLKDGVSVNNDGLNDDFDLCNLPEAFPNFEINIFNRYGTVVYKGNKNTPLFNGTSNVALTVGKKLATGVYFYVFDPKDGITAPFQGNLYLSR